MDRPGAGPSRYPAPRPSARPSASPHQPSGPSSYPAPSAFRQRGQEGSGTSAATAPTSSRADSQPSRPLRPATPSAVPSSRGSSLGPGSRPTPSGAPSAAPRPPAPPTAPSRPSPSEPRRAPAPSSGAQGSKGQAKSYGKGPSQERDVWRPPSQERDVWRPGAGRSEAGRSYEQPTRDSGAMQSSWVPLDSEVGRSYEQPTREGGATQSSWEENSYEQPTRDSSAMQSSWEEKRSSSSFLTPSYEQRAVGVREPPPPPSPSPASLRGAGKKLVPEVGKRSLPPPLVAAKGAGKRPSSVTLRVAAASQQNDLGLAMLLGDYVDWEENHERRSYKRLGSIPGHEDTEVYLYFWDDPDDDLRGWWFGDAIGGHNVWARHDGSSQAPPVSGWRVPWDAEDQRELISLEFLGAQATWPAPSQKTTPQTPGPTRGPSKKSDVPDPVKAETRARVEHALSGGSGHSSVEALERSVTQSVKKATDTLSGFARPENVRDRNNQKENLRGIELALNTKASEVTKAQERFEQTFNELKKSGESLSPSMLAELSQAKQKFSTMQASLDGAQQKAKRTQKQAEERRAEEERLAEDKQQAEEERRRSEEKRRYAEEERRLAEEERRRQELELRQQELEEQQQEEQRRLKEKEDRELQSFRDSLPAVNDCVYSAEDAVETLSAMAADIEEGAETEGGDRSVIEGLLNDVDESIKKAHSSLAGASRKVAEEMGKVKRFVTEARTGALEKLTSLQSLVTALEVKAAPFKTFKKNYMARMEVRTQIEGLSKRLGAVDFDAEKQYIVVSASKEGQLPDAEFEAAEKVMQSAKVELSAVLAKAFEMSGGEHVESELRSLRERAGRVRSKLADTQEMLQRQREKRAVQGLLAQSYQRMEKTEEVLLRMAEAELPFKKGIEVLPIEEALAAAKDCEAVAQEAELVANDVSGAVSKAKNDMKKYSKEAANSLAGDLKELSEKLDAFLNKVKEFRSETARRKSRSLLQDVNAKLGEADGAVKALTAKVTEVFSSASVESSSAADLQEKVLTIHSAVRLAVGKCQEVRQLLTDKSKAFDPVRDKETHDELSKVGKTVSSLQQEVARLQKESAISDALIKGKKAIADEEGKLDTLEGEVAKLEELAASLANASPGEAKPNLEAAEKVHALIGVAMKRLDALMLAAPVPMKELFSKLLSRVRKCKDRVEKVRTAFREKREVQTADALLSEALGKTDAAERTLEKLGEAELPFLKGIETLPLVEALATVSGLEEALKSANAVIAEASADIAIKKTEINRLGDKASKPAMKSLEEMRGRVDKVAAKVAQSQKDTQLRKRSTLMQEAKEKVARLEVEVLKTAEMAAPLASPNPGEVSEEAARGFCKELAEFEEATLKLLSDTEACLMDRRRDSRKGSESVSAGDSLEGDLKKLQARYEELRVEFAKARISARDHEQRLVAKKLVLEATNMVVEVETAVEKARDAAGALLLDQGAALHRARHLRTLREALKEDSKTRELSQDGLFEELCGQSERAGADGSNPAPKLLAQADFIAFLEKLPEKLKREDFEFSAETRQDLFRYLDADADGHLDLSEFLVLFRERCMCVQPISMTDNADIRSSKTLRKLDVNEIVETLGEVNANESGVTRVECRHVNSKVTGWVTLKGNQGTKYLEPCSSYESFVTSVDKLIEAAVSKANKVSTLIKTKTWQLKSYEHEALTTTRQELSKLKSRVASTLSAVGELNNSLNTSKKGFVKREEDEKKMQQETWDRKEVGTILSTVREKAGTLQLALDKFEDIAKPLIEASKSSNLEAFATPCSARNAIDEVGTTLAAQITSVEASVKECDGSLEKKATGPFQNGRQELQKILANASAAAKKRVTTIELVNKVCRSLAASLLGKAVGVLREDLQKRNIAAEALFSELAAGSELIPEEAFCKYISTFSSSGFSEEQALLLTQHWQPGGISKRCLEWRLQRYMECAAKIAATTHLEIKIGTTLRTVEAAEIVEVLEGPRVDEKLGVMRVRARALSDGVEGWISVKGNQGGKVFLVDAQKPFLSCTVQVPLEKDFKSSDPDGPIRKLKTDEVLEVLEGPKREESENVVRAKGKASKDGKVGWFTVKSTRGQVNADKSTQIFVCKMPIAMTDQQDIKASKCLCKCAAGEVFRLEEGPLVDGTSSVTRMRCTSIQSGSTGWITVKGNQGTVYAEESTKHYTMLRETAMEANPESEGATTLRTLAQGEAIEVLEGPREEKSVEVMRVKCRALVDNSTGWTTAKTLKPWAPNCKCSRPTPLHDNVSSGDARELRLLEAGELVEVIDGPRDAGGTIRVCVRAERDGLIGWASVRSDQGQLQLSAISPVLRL